MPNIVYALQKFALAIEEAQEVLDRRAGREPATQHNPLDFLDPPEGATLAADEDPVEEPAEKLVGFTAPQPADAKVVAAASAQEAVGFVHALARDPHRACETVSWIPCASKSSR